MQVTFGPQVARRVLRYELDRLCAQAGKNHRQVGDRLGMSRVAFTHITSGRNLLSKPALEVLLDFVGRPDRLPLMLQLLALAKSKSDQPAESSVHDVELAVGLEGLAVHIEAFAPMTVHSLLQTQGYARELIVHWEPGVDVERNVALRLGRQSVLTRENPAELWCVIEEQALRRPIGDATVMAGQFDHLLEITNRPNVTVQVLPHDVGPHPALKGAFVLLTIDDGWRVAYEVTRRSVHYHDLPEALDDYATAMSHLRRLALNPKRSRTFLAMLRKETRL
ncbi:MAG TPA: helix-turn-helix transcriptional regulator [Pseudonocardiaceae bacterium]|nr:helix-turn-helix transcriptional regulator [Pseudonocardiaceae bacterium]